MKYKLINKTTGEEYICDKVVVDGSDCYVSGKPKVGDFVIEYQKYDTIGELHFIKNEYVLATDIQKKVIATNNPNISVPRVVDEVEILGKLAIKQSNKFASSSKTDFTLGFIDGYNKSQETHPFSEDDMIEFLEWYKNHLVQYPTKELLEIWKDRQIKTVYYE